MSQLALFYLLDASKMAEMQEHARIEVVKKLFSKKYINHFDEYLKTNAELLYGLDPGDWNAPPFITATAWMAEEKGVDFFEGEFKDVSTVITEKAEASTFIWTKQVRDVFRSQINIENISFDELKRICLEYGGEDSDEDAEVLRDAIRVLGKVLDRIEDGKVVVFWVC